MKKKIMYMMLALMLVGCSKSVDVPKLKPLDLTYEYGQKVSLEIEDLVDVSDYTKDEIKELEKNGEVDTSEIVYDDNGNIVPGTYNVEVSYYSDVVEAKVIITSEDDSPFEHTIIDNIEIEQGDYDFDFKSVITITSKYGLEVTVTYGTEEILVDEPGVYSLHVKAVDTAGNEMTYDYQVTIVAKETEEETQEETTVDSTTTDTTTQQSTTTQTTTSQTTTTTTTQPATNHTTTTTTPAANNTTSNTNSNTNNTTTTTVTPTPTPTPSPAASETTATDNTETNAETVPDTSSDEGTVETPAAE